MENLQFYQVEKRDRLAWVYLNQETKRNAMGPAAWFEPVGIMEELDNDHDIRAIIVAGRGICFSAGIDLKEMVPEIGELMNPDQTGAIKWRLLPKIRKLQTGISAFASCRKPVIAAIHGHCIGAGLDLATACDIRICSQDAQFCLKEAAVGFVADVGVLQRLPLIVGQGHTRELAYTARTIDAQRALEIGLVNAVFADEQSLFAEAEKMALEIANNSPLAVQASKDVLNYCAGKSVEDGLQYVASISTNIIPSRDFQEAVAAFKEKRTPKFSGN